MVHPEMMCACTRICMDLLLFRQHRHLHAVHNAFPLFQVVQYFCVGCQASVQTASILLLSVEIKLRQKRQSVVFAAPWSFLVVSGSNLASKVNLLRWRCPPCHHHCLLSAYILCLLSAANTMSLFCLAHGRRKRIQKSDSNCCLLGTRNWLRLGGQGRPFPVTS